MRDFCNNTRLRRAIQSKRHSQVITTLNVSILVSRSTHDLRIFLWTANACKRITRER